MAAFKSELGPPPAPPVAAAEPPPAAETAAAPPVSENGDPAGRSEVYAWTAMPTKEVLESGETLPFRSRLASPPGEGCDVTVRFFTRLDATAGLR